MSGAPRADLNHPRTDVDRPRPVRSIVTRRPNAGSARFLLTIFSVKIYVGLCGCGSVGEHSNIIDPDDVADRLSAAYLIAVNARTVSEVGAIAASTATGTHLPTLTIDTVIGFRSSNDRAAFATDLQSAVTALIARYHHNDGRPHRLTVSSYPRPQEPS